MRRMRSKGRLQFPTALQALQPILADGLQQEQAWLTRRLLHLAQQMDFQQAAYPIQDVSRGEASLLDDGLAGRKRAVTGKDGKPAVDLLLLSCSQLVIPSHG